MSTRTRPIRLANVIVIGTLLSVSALAWVLSASSIVTNIMMESAYRFDPVMMILFTSTWTLGMVAMMFPTVAPVILMLFRAGKNANPEVKAGGGPTVAKAFTFATTYISLWVGLGVVLYLVLSALTLFRSTWNADMIYFESLPALIVIGSGVYQMTPLKERCLDRCHPSSFLFRSFRGGTTGAALMGASYGFYCLGCCWILMVNLLLVGAMNLVWMGIFAAAIFVERITPERWNLSTVIGLSLLALGTYMVTQLLIT